RGVPGDRCPAAAQLRRPRAHRGARLPHASRPGAAGADSWTGGARVDPRPRHAGGHGRAAAQSPPARLDVRVDPHGGSRAARLLLAAGLLAAGQLLAPTQAGRSFAWALLPAFIGLSVVRPGGPGFSTFYL